MGVDEILRMAHFWATNPTTRLENVHNEHGWAVSTLVEFYNKFSRFHKRQRALTPAPTCISLSSPRKRINSICMSAQSWLYNFSPAWKPVEFKMMVSFLDKNGHAPFTASITLGVDRSCAHNWLPESDDVHYYKEIVTTIGRTFQQLKADALGKILPGK
ncbi:hypothetical protein QR680_007241 [Steinernema hermaphroditum]|uniref:Uncharacterized protein n=1 Tax=Steinernema hermaphroditum TaxID=289476 RepID=A0AA39LYH5_9BILA|nr:hypothetical protein QR680_007241 [Steinernema hermaphroditum]